ncbi:MAG: DUF6160 family protein [Pseudomonadota bacterium]
MKFVKTTALAAAVAASFGAQAELKAMDDASLEAVTGQAGFTITTDFAGTEGIDISLGDDDGYTGSGSSVSTIDGSAGYLNIFDVQNEGTINIDFDGGANAIVLEQESAMTITFALGVADANNTAPTNTGGNKMADVRIALPAGMTQTIQAH